MNVKIIELLTLLDEETACYQSMQNVLIDEETSISLSRKEPFDRVQYEKESLVVKLQQLEEKRKTLVDQLSGAYATDGESMTVTQLAGSVKPPTSEKLMSRASRLRSIIEDVREKNRRNQLLINQNLDLVKGSLKLLTNLIIDSPVYQKPGTHQSSVGYQAPGGRFICGTV
ncbi:MAG: flagellar protein FlgN [Deltaproteobacteria bacterium]|nr:flagellar protein FlgN [Deltaproteobacteria bacterium]